MKNKNHQWVARTTTYLGLAAAFFFVGEWISFWWLLLTGAVSMGVWLIIWLWPEQVSERN